MSNASTSVREFEEEDQEVTLIFDVAVLDLGLPDGNGTDLIAELRTASPGVGC